MVAADTTMISMKAEVALAASRRERDSHLGWFTERDWLILRWCEIQIWGERSGSCLRSQKHPVPPPGPERRGRGEERPPLRGSRMGGGPGYGVIYN